MSSFSKVKTALNYICFSRVKECNVTSKLLLLEHVVLWSSEWRNTKKHTQYWVPSMLQLKFLHKLKAQLFHFCLNRNRFTYKICPLWNVVGVVSCVTIPIVRKQWNFLSNILYFVLQTLFSPEEVDLVEKPLIQILASESLKSEISWKLLGILIHLD